MYAVLHAEALATKHGSVADQQQQDHSHDAPTARGL